MLSALILSRPGYPAVPRAGQPAHQRSVLPNPLVLGETLLKFPTPTADRDRPVSRRSEPSSRTAFIGEQPNPWDLLQPQDAMSRHRGAKPPRRCGRSGEISLLSPEYLLLPRRPVSGRNRTFGRHPMPGSDVAGNYPPFPAAMASPEVGYHRLTHPCATGPTRRPGPSDLHA